MKQPYVLPKWAPRVKPYLIRRLYECDAQGLLDSELLDEVGWALYSRCDNFIRADEARKGRVICPVCGAVLAVERGSKALMHCAACGWVCPYRAYMATIKNQQLDGGPEVVGLFQAYLDAFPKAKEPADKMVLVDGLIHGFHHFLTSGRTRRPVGINLIDGHLEFVVDFLDHLSYGDGSTQGVRETFAAWRERVKGSWGRRPAG